MQFEAEGARALDTARHRGATYADVRFEIGAQRADRGAQRRRRRALRHDAPRLRHSRAGRRRVGVRGQSRTAPTTAIDATAARAVAIAQAGAAIARSASAEVPGAAYVDRIATPFERDPATVPLGERVALLLEAERMLHVAPRSRRPRLDRPVAHRQVVLQHDGSADRAGARPDRQRHLGAGRRRRRRARSHASRATSGST